MLSQTSPSNLSFAYFYGMGSRSPKNVPRGCDSNNIMPKLQSIWLLPTEDSSVEVRIILSTVYTSCPVAPDKMCIWHVTIHKKRTFETFEPFMCNKVFAV